MRIFVCALLLGAVACYSPSSKTSYLSQQSIEDVKNPSNAEEPILLRVRNNSVSSSTSELPQTEASGTTIRPNSPISDLVPTMAAATSISSAKPEIEEMKPIKEEPTPAITVPAEESFSEAPEPQFPSIAVEPSRRRIVTYDQRQEGQYNIRADLDNFMIVLIPPTPAEGLNLLDILTKSAIRPTKNKRKQYASSSGHRGNGYKYRQSLKSGNTNFNMNYLPRSHQPPVTLVENANVQRMPSEFIEGRTPYHVDISASDDEQSRLHPDGPVDVLPPPYPLAYQHLIKPFHLDAEPTVIQALPPSDINQVPPHASGNFLETYNQLLASSLNSAVNDEEENNPGLYRLSRTIRNEDYLDSNRLVSNSLNSLAPRGRRVQIPLYRADMSYGASHLYPPLDVPKLMGYITANSESNKVLLDDNSFDKRPQQLEDQRVDEILILPSRSEESLYTNGVRFMDGESRTLLTDVRTDMERCAPGSRRDSYGICRELEGY